MEAEWNPTQVSKQLLAMHSTMAHIVLQEEETYSKAISSYWRSQQV